MDAPRARTVTCPSCGSTNRVPVTPAGRPRCGRCKADLPWVVEADDDTFDQAVATRGVPVLVDLWASWCGPCRTMAPVIDHIAEDRAGHLKVVKVDVDRAPGVARRHGVQGVPTLVVYRDGAEVARHVGALGPDALRSLIDRAGAVTGA